MFLKHLKQPEQRSRRIPDHDNRAFELVTPELQSRSAARGSQSCLASSAVLGSPNVQRTSLFTGSRDRVTPLATMFASQRIVAPLRIA